MFSSLALPTAHFNHCPLVSNSKILLHMLQKGKSVLWIASFKGRAEIVLLLLRHHAAVDLPNDVRHCNTMYTVDIDACICACNSHCYIVIDSEKPLC